MTPRFLFACILAASLLGGAAISAAEKKRSTPPPKQPVENVPDPGDAPEEKKPADPNQRLPYHGKVTAVDPAAKTFRLKGPLNRLFRVTEKTTIKGRDGAAAQLAGLAVGDEVSGSAIRTADTWTATSVYIRGAGAPASAKKSGGVPPPAATPVPPPDAKRMK